MKRRLASASRRARCAGGSFASAARQAAAAFSCAALRRAARLICALVIGSSAVMLEYPVRKIRWPSEITGV
jgi:hypothetical protein